jgi:YVTN family beta-propeller protein
MITCMTDLPSGAVTFLFTDIEGSTRLVKELRGRYAEVRADHERLLRAAFAAHGGHEVDTQGDAFFVAFASARDAVLAALEGQRALLSHSWPEGATVKVRMGLHTGQAVVTDGRYTGLAVHRAARIGAAGHGGQVLLSQATQTLLEDEEEDLHITMRDLGEQRLKDLDRPVRLYQATADGLPTSFPPLRDAPEASADAVRPRPLWRRPVVLAAAAAAVGAVVAAAVLLTRDSTGGLAGVQANHVGVIDPSSNEILAEVPVGIRPGPVAGGDGSVWVGNLDDRTLTRIDAAAQTSVGAIPLDRRTPTGLAVGAGAVWVAHGLLGSMSRVDPAFDQIEELRVTTSASATQDGAVTVAAGSVWVVYGNATVAQVDPRERRVVASGLAGSGAAAIAFGDGAVWIANRRDRTVQRFNAASLGLVGEVAVGLAPTGLAFGAGSIWVANEAGNSVMRIDPGTMSVASTIEVGDGPKVVAFGAGAVWVACSRTRTVDRIDPATNDVTAAIEIGNTPAGIAVERGLVWVAAQEP